MPRRFRSIQCLMFAGLAACGAENSQDATTSADGEQPLYGAHTQALTAEAEDSRFLSPELDDGEDEGGIAAEDDTVSGIFTLRCGSDIATKPSRVRGAGTPPNQCAAGEEYDTGLCYAACRDGYHGAGPYCWQTCPDGYRDDGADCWGGFFDIIWKDSYYRGVGTVPNTCGAGKEYDTGLCYSRCPSGFHGVGPVCWGTCPTGYRDDGGTCSGPIHCYPGQIQF